MEKSIPDLLAEHAFFRDMPPQALDLLAGCGKNVHYEAGRYIAQEGDEANTFYALRRGRVAVQVHAPGGGAVVVQTLGVGDVLGWSWLFPPHQWHFDAVALEPTSAVEFDGACLRGKCESDVAIGFGFVRRFAHVIVQQLEAARLQLLDIYGRTTSS
jgi:CRP-like cAMP-binding protein